MVSLAKAKLEWLFFITGIILFGIISLFFSPYQDLYTQDNTYFVMWRSHIGISFLIVFLFFAFFYFIFKRINRPLNKVLGIVHYLLTLISLATFITLLQGYPIDGPRRYYRFDVPGQPEQITNPNSLLTLCAIVFLTGQLLFLINLVLTLARKRHWKDAR
jgi:heme/copper-type cytochrome/quinol oxidase subunit 1